MTSAVAVSVQLSRPHAAQQRIIDESRRFNVCICGRRFGKTVLGIDRLTGPAIKHHQPVGWFSATYKLLGEAWRDVKGVWRPVITKVSEEDHRLELLGGGTLEMWTLENNDDAGRSRKYAAVVIDESASVKNLKVAWEGAIRPTLADLRGDAWFLGTPRGFNYTYELWLRGQDEDQTDWASWQLPTSANPFIHPDEIEAARRDLPPAMFAQEYLASFQAMADARFDIDAVNEGLAGCRPPLAAVNGLPETLRRYM